MIIIRVMRLLSPSSAMAVMMQWAKQTGFLTHGKRDYMFGAVFLLRSTFTAISESCLQFDNNSHRSVAYVIDRIAGDAYSLAVNEHLTSHSCNHSSSWNNLMFVLMFQPSIHSSTFLKSHHKLIWNSAYRSKCAFHIPLNFGPKGF